MPDAPTRPALVRQETLVESIAEGDVDTTQTNARYLGYLARIRPLLLPATRWPVSDAEQLRRPIHPMSARPSGPRGLSSMPLIDSPVVSPRLVTTAYGISIAYKGHLDWTARSQQAGAKSSELPGQTTEVGLRVAKRAIFQGSASLLFPALTIRTPLSSASSDPTDSAVKYSKPVFRRTTNIRLRAWGPTLVGRATLGAIAAWLTVPQSPSFRLCPIVRLSALRALTVPVFDEPVEHILDKAWPTVERLFLPEGTTPSRPHVVHKEKEL